MEKIKIKLARTESFGLLHDGRADARTIIKTVNILIDKINEIVEEINKLNSEQNVQENK